MCTSHPTRARPASLSVCLSLSLSLSPTRLSVSQLSVGRETPSSCLELAHLRALRLRLAPPHATPHRGQQRAASHHASADAAPAPALGAATPSTPWPTRLADFLEYRADVGFSGGAETLSARYAFRSALLEHNSSVQRALIKDGKDKVEALEKQVSRRTGRPPVRVWAARPASTRQDTRVRVVSRL